MRAFTRWVPSESNQADAPSRLRLFSGEGKTVGGLDVPVKFNCRLPRYVCQSGVSEVEQRSGRGEKRTEGQRSAPEGERERRPDLEKMLTHPSSLTPSYLEERAITAVSLNDYRRRLNLFIVWCRERDLAWSDLETLDQVLVVLFDE
eukprot:6921982-Karenia_brevis.AAC.1